MLAGSGVWYSDAVARFGRADLFPFVLLSLFLISTKFGQVLDLAGLFLVRFLGHRLHPVGIFFWWSWVRPAYAFCLHLHF